MNAMNYHLRQLDEQVIPLPCSVKDVTDRSAKTNQLSFKKVFLYNILIHLIMSWMCRESMRSLNTECKGAGVKGSIL